MLYHDQDTALVRPSGVRIHTCLLLDPTLQPTVAKPIEEDIQDAKLLYYFSKDEATIHTIRNNVGLAEGLVVFFSSFCDTPSTEIEVELDSARVVVDQIEQNLFIAFILEEVATDESKRDLTRDWAKRFVRKFYSHWTLFYGRLNSWRQPDHRFAEDFKLVLDNFIDSFVRLGSSTDDQTEVSPLHLGISGLERFGLQRAHFQVTNQLESILKEPSLGIDRWVLFYKTFFIYGDLDYDDALVLKEYLFAFGRHPKHMTFVEKFADFRKCTLDFREGVRMCRYGLVNLAKETREVLLGDIGDTKGGERFVPVIHLPHRNTALHLPQPHLPPDKYDFSTEPTPPADGLDKFDLYMLRVGNFILPLLCKPGNRGVTEQFSQLKSQVKALLEHCERMILNQISLVESAVQKKSTVLSAIIYNEVNRSVIYYPFNKFTLASFSSPLAAQIERHFETAVSQLSVCSLDLFFDGWNVCLTKWNQRTVLVLCEDRKISYKDFLSSLAAFRAGLTDIFL